MRRIGTMLMACVLTAALCLCAALAQAETYASRLIQQMENYDHPSFVAAADFVQGYDAAVIAMDACSASGEFYRSVREAVDLPISVSALTAQGQPAHEIALLYVFDDEAWRVTADAKNFQLRIDLVADEAHTIDDAQRAELVQRMGAGEHPVNGEYFWAYFMQIFVMLTGDPVESEPTVSGGTGGVEMQARVHPIDNNRSVRIDISVNMEITEEMSDFVFLVNGTEIIEAHANPNSNTVIGRYTATRNGLYTFLLGYKINGEEVTQQIDVQVSEIEDPEHEHAFELAVIPEHPHVRYACACGKEGELPTPQGPGVWTPFENMECCQCGYHEWSGPVQQKNGSYKIYCQRENCGASQSYTLRQAEEVTQAILELESDWDVRREYLRPDGTEGRAAYWRSVANHAVSKLTEAGFTATTEALEAYSDISGSMAKAAGLVKKKDYEALQVAAWETYIVDMLTQQEKEGKNVFEQVGGVTNAVSNVGKWVDGADEYLENWGGVLDDTKLGEGLEEVFDLMSKIPGIELELDPDERGDGSTMMKFGCCVNMISAMSDGLDASSDAKKLFEDFEEMIEEFDMSMRILNELIAAAKTSGNTLLEEAAKNVKTRLEEQTSEKISYVFSVAGQGMKAVGVSTLKWGGEEIAEEMAKKVAKHILPDADDMFIALGRFEDLATLAKNLMQWGDAYNAAQDLMLLQDMTNSMDIYNVLNETDSYYLAELWTNLQIAGAEKSKEFLVKYDEGFGLNMRQLNIGDLDTMLGEIDGSIEAYEAFIGTLRQIRAQHSSAK